MEVIEISSYIDVEKIEIASRYLFPKQIAANGLEKCAVKYDKDVIKEAIEVNGLKPVEDITNYTKAGGACGKCKAEIQQILNKVLACENPLPAKKQFKDLTIVEKIKEVENILNTEVKPRLNLDGGSIELIDIQGSTITVRMLGMCGGCANAKNTIKSFVEKVLKEKLDPSLEVRQA